jgi:hypothetical protein
MDLGSLIGVLVANMLDNILMIRNKVMAKCFGMMVVFIKDFGPMDNKME